MCMISGLMAVRNLEGVVAQTIESVLGQTRDDWELVIVDDASTDGTVEVIRSYDDPRIHLVELTEWVGRARARNAAAGRATGEFLAVVDGDDVCEPRRFEICAAYLQEHQECAVVSGQVRHLFADGSLRRLVAYPTDPGEITARFDRGSMGVSHAACMIRRVAFESYGGYHAGSLRAQDLELFLRMYRREGFANLPDTLLQYRNTPSAAGLAFWLELHRYHEYGRYRSALTSAAVNPAGVLDFAEWRRGVWRSRRVYTRHLLRFVKNRFLVSTRRVSPLAPPAAAAGTELASPETTPPGRQRGRR